MFEEYPSEPEVVGTGTDQPVATIERGVPSGEAEQLWLDGKLDRLIIYGGKEHLENIRTTGTGCFVPDRTADLYAK